MQTFRKMLIVIFAPLLAFSLFTGIITLSITNYLGSPEHIKHTLQESKIYDNLVQDVITEVQKKQGDQKGGGIAFSNPEIQAAIKKALPPTFWQDASEQIINGVYSWLNGDSSRLAFTVDLKQAKENFISSVASYVVTKAEGLPACTSHSQTDDPNDLLNMTCRPSDFNPEEVRQKIITEAQNDEFLGNDEYFDATDLQSEDGQPIEQKLIVIKQGYTLSKKLPVLLFVISFVLTILLFFLCTDRISGLRKIKSTYISSGVSILVFSGIAWLVFKKVSVPSINIGDFTNSDLQNSVILAVNSIFDSIVTVLFIGGAIYLLVGLVCWLVVRRLNPPLSEEQRQNNVNTVLKTKELSDENSVDLDQPDEPKPKDSV